MTPNGLSYGWYGKVPCVGDFIRSGLSPAFMTGWDRWMRTLLATAAETLGDRWDDCYLSAPIWRFALPTGACGPHAVAGIMMPSVDRVGRRFPLCLAAELGNIPVKQAYHGASPDFDALEDAALMMLEDGTSLTLLKETLAGLPRSDPGPDADADADANGSTRNFAALDASATRSLWVAPIGEEDRVLLPQGLPEDPDTARAFFDLHA
ncbi:type VI secretion system-associated protein TagF [Rhodospirillum sp. A1_3_36]|uniref:type VI secretion system-associated protein TagF n=1 Tax=Rhodospirillum sp. A1_3_36 TaxID=3391666 RepID=UPI0039A60616